MAGSMTHGDAAALRPRPRPVPADLIAWVQATQPKAWEALTKNHGAGRRDRPARPPAQAARRPRHAGRAAPRHRDAGPEAAAATGPVQAGAGDEPGPPGPLCQANRLRVVRQVHYSLHNENSLDLVLFLNGMPVATGELKTDFTQSVERRGGPVPLRPRPAAQGPGHARAAAGLPAAGRWSTSPSATARCTMTTRLQGPATPFLPFNQGDEGGAGNPPNPDGHRTAYLWERSGQRDSWLEILGRYLVAQRDSKKQIEKLIFPRYHQLDATRKLRRRGAGGGPGRQVPDPALGRLRQDQLHRLDGALPGRPARRRQPEGVRHACWWSPTAPCWTPSCRRRSSTSSAPPAWWRPSPATAAARAANWPRRWPAARRSWSAPSRPSPSRWRRCGSWRRPRASASP